ncbi:MAG: mannitol dehydrogenase family protein [Pseudomonadota bacterium]|nr:mannitol dehydrogenase family protein [Pseudomonadota bacterium]
MSNITAGIIHLGLGAFFRAHGAVYVQEAHDLESGNWGIIGVSLRSPAVRDTLQARNWAYTALEMGARGLIPKDISILQDVLVGPESEQLVLDAMIDEQVKIVSLTVTEKGYCLASSDGALDLDHPDIRHDLANEVPRSAPGYLVRALQERKRRGVRPFTVMSLDNLPNNGSRVRAAVLELAKKIDPSLADWIAAQGCFPSTMVDRIVPATTDTLIEHARNQFGIEDAGLVGHEPFRQWVIEDNFVDGVRPNFERVGAQFVNDVTAFEHMKLRMLNGTHSSLAYLGALAGYRSVDEACADPTIIGFLNHLWNKEIIPTLTPPEATNLKSYASSLLKRYQNPAIRHRLEQIAMDGSQKLPQRILGTINDNTSAHRPSAGLVLALAGWVRFLEGQDDMGQPLEVSDPLKDQLQSLLRNCATRTELVHGLLNVKAIFADTATEQLAPALLNALEALDRDGALKSMQKVQS